MSLNIHLKQYIFKDGDIDDGVRRWLHSLHSQWLFALRELWWMQFRVNGFCKVRFLAYSIALIGKGEDDMDEKVCLYTDLDNLHIDKENIEEIKDVARNTIPFLNAETLIFLQRIDERWYIN